MKPLVHALRTPVGSVWAPELVKHGKRYFIYLPVKASPNDILVMHAERVEGTRLLAALALDARIEVHHA